MGSDEWGKHHDEGDEEEGRGGVDVVGVGAGFRRSVPPPARARTETIAGFISPALFRACQPLAYSRPARTTCHELLTKGVKNAYDKTA